MFDIIDDPVKVGDEPKPYKIMINNIPVYCVNDPIEVKRFRSYLKNIIILVNLIQIIY